MHREFHPSEQPFAHRSNFGLYALTFIVLALLLRDLWPLLGSWLASLGLDVPTFTTREFYGYRFALLAAVIGGARILFTSLEHAADGKVGADLAVAVACIAAILMGEPLIAAEVVVIALVGECLEAITFDRTQRVLQKLVELFPTRTWVLRDGVEVRTLVADLQVGDHVIVKPGGRIPVDGSVIDGRSTVDTSSLTGESLPRDVGVGDAVLAGTINQFGSLTIDARKLAKQTVAGQVIELTGKALQEKSPIERHADKLARRFLPIVLALALIVFLVNVGLQLSSSTVERKVSFSAAARVALYPTLAVLVVACPCALILATPAAVIAALGRLAGTGILLKGSAALERLASVNAIAFDKTGTLTEGKLAVAKLIPLGVSEDELLRVAATAEQKSEHPIAKAILNAAREKVLTLAEVQEFQASAGAGVSVRVKDTCLTLTPSPLEGWGGGSASATTSNVTTTPPPHPNPPPQGGREQSTLLVGTRRFLIEQAVALTPEVDEHLSQLDADGQTAVLVARDGTLLGILGLRDSLRPEAVGVLTELQSMGMQLTLLTGDRASPAKAITRDLPFAHVHSELLPAQKAELLEADTAYIGDGINDAPALAKSAVGLAVASGSDIAAEAGDIVMMGEPLRPLPLLIRLSRETVKVIRQNILWFGYGVNLFGILLTGILWPLFATSPDWFEKAPLVGVIYHQLGSLLVLLNSMRLLTFERTTTNRTLLSAQSRYRDFDRWLNTVHADDFVHSLAHRWKAIGTGVLALAALGWLATGLVQIEANEAGVVQRFGSVRSDLVPGLHVRWPWPIETVTKLRPAEIRTVEVGFRRNSQENQSQLQLAKAAQQKLRKPGLPGISDRDLSWASAHAEEVTPLTDESLMITGDGNLVELLATVRYTVTEPRKFLFGTRDPDAVIRSQSEAIFRELVAGQPFQELLTYNREAFERAARESLTRWLHGEIGQQLGVQLDGLTVHDLHPPQEVVASYHNVAEAIQKRDRLVNEAEADATRTKRRAEEESLRLVRQSETEAIRKTSEATASRDAFLAWHKARTQLTTEEEAALQKELESRVKAGEARATVEADVNKRRVQLLVTRRALTEFRLSLAAISSVLSGRDKILIDAAQLPGKRHLFLADPESIKLPPGLLRPAEKDP